MPTIAELKKQQQEITRQLVSQEGRARLLANAIEQKRRELGQLERRLASLRGPDGAPVVTFGSARKRRAAKGGRKRGPTQKEWIARALADAGKPMTLKEIAAAMTVAGFHWASRDPVNVLSVVMYTDKQRFRIVKPGLFALRQGVGSGAAAVPVLKTQSA